VGCPALEQQQCSYLTTESSVAGFSCQGSWQVVSKLCIFDQCSGCNLHLFTGQHIQLKHEFDNLVHQRQQKEDCVHALQQQLSAVSCRLEEVQQQVAARAEVLQGSQLLPQRRLAVQQLQQEIHDMEHKLGVLQHQLFTCRQHRQLHQLT